MTQIAFIGGGNMASSIIGGLIKQGAVSANGIEVAEPNLEQRTHLEKRFGVITHVQNQKAIDGADVVILAVKPQVLKAVVEPLRDLLTAQQPLLISIAAGINLSSLQQWSGCQAIVRAMPNTPALLGQGATGLCANAGVNQEQRHQADALLRAVGTTSWVKTEPDIDAVTALSGSGPAYFFLLMEAMIAAGEQMGLSKQTATALTLQTALGASQMALDADVGVAELRQRVTSPGGTTEQAILSFEQAGFRTIVQDALLAARQQSELLSDKFGK